MIGYQERRPPEDRDLPEYVLAAQDLQKASLPGIIDEIVTRLRVLPPGMRNLVMNEVATKLSMPLPAFPKEDK